MPRPSEKQLSIKQKIAAAVAAAYKRNGPVEKPEKSHWVHWVDRLGKKVLEFPENQKMVGFYVWTTKNGSSWIKLKEHELFMIV